MKRLELFEFEDFRWLPDTIRSGVTNLLPILHKMTGTSEVLTVLILNAGKKSQFDQIVDLGSGSGGPMIEVIGEVNKALPTGEQINLVLTDLYPDSKTVQRINDKKLPNIRYRIESLNASDMSKSPKGLKTMIACFHHMKPAIAKKILKSAETNREPILIYELAKNNVPVLLWWLLLPLSLVILIVMSLVMTLFVRPLTFNQIFFTYIIPVIPLIYAWDGQASLMRTYTFKDIESLLDQRNDDNYVWEIAEAEKQNGKKAGYFILGYPKK